jgi:hypothetical protein
MVLYTVVTVSLSKQLSWLLPFKWKPELRLTQHKILGRPLSVQLLVQLVHCNCVTHLFLLSMQTARLVLCNTLLSAITTLLEVVVFFQDKQLGWLFSLKCKLIRLRTVVTCACVNSSAGCFLLAHCY